MRDSGNGEHLVVGGVVGQRFQHLRRKGTDVFVRKVAPLGDPIEVTVRGYELSIRKADAEIIEVMGGAIK